jgi:GTP cyclohydrolase I
MTTQRHNGSTPTNGARGNGHGGHANGANGHIEGSVYLPDLGNSMLDLSVLAPADRGNGTSHESRSGGSSLDQASLAAIEAATRSLLGSVGEDVHREGLIKTPSRVAKMYAELLEGYRQDLATVVNDAMFDVEYGNDEMVVVADIPYNSMCEHHLLPFTGLAHIAYIPRDKVIGLSKIPRIVDMFAKRLQIQERLGNEIADALVEAMAPEGVIVMVEGRHSCASLRGVKKHGANMVTTARRGAFKHDAQLRDEFFRMIGR